MPFPEKYPSLSSPIFSLLLPSGQTFAGLVLRRPATGLNRFVSLPSSKPDQLCREPPPEFAGKSTQRRDSSRDFPRFGSPDSGHFGRRSISNTSLKVRKAVVALCDIVATRGARLSAAGILGVLKKLGRDTIKDGEKHKSVVALDGGLFEHYTEFRVCMESTLNELLGDEVAEHISIEHSNDGSGIGAALLAASHSHYLGVEES